MSMAVQCNSYYLLLTFRRKGEHYFNALFGVKKLFLNVSKAIKELKIQFLSYRSFAFLCKIYTTYVCILLARFQFILICRRGEHAKLCILNFGNGQASNSWDIFKFKIQKTQAEVSCNYASELIRIYYTLCILF